MEAKSYVEQRDGGYWVAGTRVSLDSLVYAFREGHTAETLAQSFPVLTLEQVYGATMLEDSSLQRFVSRHLQEHKAELDRIDEKLRPAEELSRGEMIPDTDLWQRLGHKPRP